MNLKQIRKIKVGDRVRFRAVTRHSGAEAVRMVTGWRFNGQVQVGYHGWSDFVLANREIIEHIPRPEPYLGWHKARQRDHEVRHGLRNPHRPRV